jgi:hypothetical protein
MAYLAVVASHTVNGVAAIHSQIIKDTIFKVSGWCGARGSTGGKGRGSGTAAGVAPGMATGCDPLFFCMNSTVWGWLLHPSLPGGFPVVDEASGSAPQL